MGYGALCGQQEHVAGMGSAWKTIIEDLFDDDVERHVDQAFADVAASGLSDLATVQATRREHVLAEACL